MLGASENICVSTFMLHTGLEVHPLTPAKAKTAKAGTPNTKRGDLEKRPSLPWKQTTRLYDEPPTAEHVSHHVGWGGLATLKLSLPWIIVTPLAYHRCQLCLLVSRFDDAERHSILASSPSPTISQFAAKRRHQTK